MDCCSDSANIAYKKNDNKGIQITVKPSFVSDTWMKP